MTFVDRRPHGQQTENHNLHIRVRSIGETAGTGLVIARARGRALNLSSHVIGGNMNEDDFLIAVGEAAQDAVWKTQHPLTHHLAEDDPRRVQYLREYHISVGHQVLTAIETMLRGSSCHERPRKYRPTTPPLADFASFL